MDAILENILKVRGSSFSVIAYANPFFAAPLHFHPEYELILIEEGKGLNFVGDSVREMEIGDFMLLGSNLTHLWLSSDEHYEPGTKLQSRSVYTQFSASVFPEDIFHIPELYAIYNILKQSERGLIFSGNEIESLKDRFRGLVHAEGFAKWKGLYELLYDLATKCENEILTSPDFNPGCNCTTNVRINKVHQYINAHYQEDLSLNSIADYVGMNPSALCRYYKKHTKKKIFDYLSELRISYAMKLMRNNNLTISQVAYDCGYNSLSHFNRQFKEITGYIPTDYKQNMLM